MKQSELKKQADFDFHKWMTKWRNRLFLCFMVGASIIIAIMIVGTTRNYSRTKNKIKTRLRYFNPTITETWWGRRITWVGRKIPLTDEELLKLCD